MMKNLKFVIVIVLFFNILNVFCDSELKPKPKPKPGNRNSGGNSGNSMNNSTNSTDSGDDYFNYCAYYGLTSGEKCGTYGFNDYSFCYADVNGDPYCMLSILCAGLAECSANSDCPTGYVCSPACNYPICEPLCGTTDGPIDPYYDDAPYYDLENNRCYDINDVPLENTPPLEYSSEFDGTSYGYIVKSQIQSESSKSSFILGHLDVAIFSSLVVVTIVGTFLIIYSSRLSSQSTFQELSTMESVDRIAISKDLELEPVSSKRNNNNNIQL